MLAAGVHVPPGFALACAAYPGRDQPMLATVRDEIAARYAELGDGGHAGVAVRSSAVGEDSAEATFAGQQETVLWVRGAAAVFDAVVRCWASLYSPAAVAYRARLGDHAPEPAMGVTVQAMVDAEVAGVLFTCNPISGDRSMVAINASWGLGVAVVGGEVTPDDYLVSKVTGEVVRERIGSKGGRVRSGSGRRRRGRGAASSLRRRDRAASDGGAARVAGRARAGRVRGATSAATQDIEWAIARPVSCIVLQSRPVTTAAQQRPSRRRRRRCRW